MEQDNQIEITSKTSLYIWRAAYSFLAIFLIVFILVFLFSLFSDLFANSDRILFNPHISSGTEIGDIVLCIIFLIGILLLINWLIRIILRSKHFFIGDKGILYNDQAISWSEITKITAYGGNVPIVVLKLRPYKKFKKIIGVLPIFSAKKKVNELSMYANKCGIKITRWFI